MKFHKGEPVGLDFQIRALADGSSQFEGYAAVFDQPSKPIVDELARGRPYTETIAPGAFRRSLGSSDRKSFVVDHNERQMISSTPSGSLKLSEDSRGLHVESPWPSTDYANNVRALYEAGERPGMSILFGTPRTKASSGALAEQWNERHDQRRVNEAVLRHVSVLATMEPAYAGTVASFRALADSVSADFSDVASLFMALHDGRKLTPTEQKLLARAVFLDPKGATEAMRYSEAAEDAAAAASALSTILAVLSDEADEPDDSSTLKQVVAGLTQFIVSETSEVGTPDDEAESEDGAAEMPMMDADRAATEKWKARLAEIEAQLPH
jgi:HK97 family phage prohead protease